MLLILLMKFTLIFTPFYAKSVTDKPITSLGLTMVFTEKDRVVIQFLRQNKGYSIRCLVKEFR